MVEIEGILTEDRKLLVEIPDTLPAGRVRITIDPVESIDETSLTGDQIRQRLAAAGHLRAPKPAHLARPNIAPLILPPGAKTTDELIDEDRGPR